MDEDHQQVSDDSRLMELALECAIQAGERGEIPIGAVITDSTGTVLAATGNEREARHDPTAHAEILSLRQAGERIGDWRLEGCTMFVTLEPCPMCAGAIAMSRLPRLVIGAWNDEYGAAGSRWDLVRDRRMNHQVEVIQGIKETECGSLVRKFLSERRTV